MTSVRPFRFESTTLFVWLLVAAAGLTDALLYLHSKEMLAVYMTGNSSKMAQFLQQGNLAKALPLLAIVLAFVAGTTLAAWLGNKASSWRAPRLLLLVALLLALACPFVSEKFALGTVLLISAAMGALNQVRRSEAGVTFITGTLVRLGRVLAAGEFRSAGSYALRWLIWVIAAFIGALLDSRFAQYSLLAVVLWCLSLAAIVTINHLVLTRRLKQRAARQS
ncbi:DUF1275 family protein [Kalamiella sp. sgz302252]|uniref:DUF1275 family protein n=1 Tax=Pantoea sp. sgz302252 TaxID=3341827 RepID=UPI0036D31825